MGYHTPEKGIRSHNIKFENAITIGFKMPLKYDT